MKTRVIIFLIIIQIILSSTYVFAEGANFVQNLRFKAAIHNLIIVSGVFFLFFSGLIYFQIQGRNKKSQDKKSQDKNISIFVLFGVGLLVRVLIAPLIEGYSFDVSTFKTWSSYIAGNFSGIYNEAFINKQPVDYPPLYMYILFIIGKIAAVFKLNTAPWAYTLLIKSPAILSDLATSYLLYRVSRKYCRIEMSLYIAGIYIFNPAVFINSAVWGQVDSILALLIVSGLVLIEEDKIHFAAIFFTAAVLFKPQGIIFLPVLLFELVKKKNVRSFILSSVYSLITAVLFILPFAISREPLWIFKLYINTLSKFKFASVNAFNLFYLLGGNMKKDSEILFIFSYNTWGTIFIILLTAFVSYLYISCIKGKGTLLSPVFSLILITGIFVLSSRIHERYSFPMMAVALLAYTYLKDKRLLILFMAFSITSFLNTDSILVKSLFNNGNLFGGYGDAAAGTVSLANVILFIYLVKLSVDTVRLRISNHEKQNMVNKMGPNYKPANNKSAKSSTVTLPELQFGYIYILIASAVLLVVVFMLWLTPRPIGDIFVALAGGRDALSGRLGKPDDWSFTTGGRVWINQNWGTDVIFYIMQRFLGNAGLLMLKAVLIGISALFSVLSARKRGVPLAVSLTVSAAVLSLLSSYIDLRPNLMTLTMAPLVLWLLYRTQGHPHRIWVVALAVVVWANVHGGFVFGIGMMCLWAACLSIQAIMNEGAAGIKRSWQYAAGAAAAILLAGLATPFGLANLTEPFLMTDKIWRSVGEWMPIWNKMGFGSTWEFITILCLLAVLFVWRFIASQVAAVLYPVKRSIKQPLWRQNIIGLVLFEAGLDIVVIAMAFNSRRFIPLAMLIILPTLAAQIWWMIRSIRRQWLVIGLVCAVLVFSIVSIQKNLKFYNPNYPFTDQGSFFERMHFINGKFSYELARFISDNNISGNVLCDWTWEGFLRWYCPTLKVFIGGRAQQVYDVKTYMQYYELLDGRSPQELLQRYDIHLIAIPGQNDRYKNLINRIMQGDRWAIVFSNGSSLLLMDSGWPQGSDFINRELSGKLIFNDNATAAMSQSACALSPVTKQDRLRGILKLEESLRLKPSSSGYIQLAQTLLSDTKLAAQVEGFFKQELKRLNSMDVLKPRGGDVLMSRLNISDALSRYYSARNMDEEAANANESLRSAQLLYDRMLKQWK